VCARWGSLDELALIICGGSFDTLAFNAFGAYHGTSVGFWLLPIGGVILASGAVLDYLAHGGVLAPTPSDRSRSTTPWSAVPCELTIDAGVPYVREHAP
jgi:hypothetical protein